jgi:hypothetical protein
MEDNMKDQVKEALLEILGVGLKHDATGVPTTVYGHGQDSNAQGVFTYPGVDPAVFSSIMGNERGLIGMLPKFPSPFTNPVFQCITGVQADVGAEPTTVCGAAPTGGYTKTCKLLAVFGRYRRQTREIYLDRIGMRRDLADPDYLRVVNSPFLGEAPITRPDIVPAMGDIVSNEIAKILFEFGASVNALISRQVFSGNPANNSGEAYKEFPGLDILISTGKVDAETNTACPSLNSDIKNFNYGLVDAVNSQIIDYITAMARYLTTNASGMGFDPTSWVLVMRPDLFYEITAIWPCRYYTYRCQTNRDTAGLDPVGTFDSVQMTKLRDEMRKGRFLIIDGVQWPVVLDHGIVEESCDDTGNLECGRFASDIYFVPLTVLGGTPVTYVEYFQHQNADMASAQALGADVKITNNGAWIFTKLQTHLCILWQGKVEPRIVLRTPQLAGRITNVAYEPLQHVRDPFPADGYFTDGGVTSRTARSDYSEWSAQ